MSSDQPSASGQSDLEARAGVRLGRISSSGADLDEAAMVAARAFFHDPFFEYLDSRGVTRARGLAIFFRASVAAAGAHARLLGARDGEGRLMGVSVVLDPDSYPLPASSQARQMAGALRALALRPQAIPAGIRYLLAIDQAHPKERLWYLQLLVVDPLAQRRGIGGLLQADMLRRADEEGVGCYLETQKPQNIAYYRRFGYDLVDHLIPVPGGPPLYTMRRDPL